MSLDNEPKKALLRASDVVKWTGISIQEFHKSVRAGVVPYKIINRDGKRWFKKDDIKKLFLEGFDTKG